MVAQPNPKLTAAEYLAFERDADVRHAFLDGDVFAMTGASRPHNLINTNISTNLHGQVRARGCEVYTSDMRVHIPETGLYTYSDVVVACGEPRYEDAELDTLLNPTLIVEVLSPSTEDHDRGSKLVHYRSIDSFVDYLLVAQQRVHVEHFARQADGRWLLTETHDPASTIEIASIGDTLTVRDIYDGVPGLA